MDVSEPVPMSNSSVDVDLGITQSYVSESVSQSESLFDNTPRSSVIGDNDVGKGFEAEDDSDKNGSAFEIEEYHPSIDTDLELGFDAFEGFDKPAEQFLMSPASDSPASDSLPNTSHDLIESSTSSGVTSSLNNKRTIDKAFRANNGQLSKAPAVKKLATAPAVLSMPVIPAHEVPSVLPSTPASIVSKERFEIDSPEILRHLASEVTSTFPFNPASFSSPYKRVGYNPSTPAMHPKVVHFSDEAINYRLEMTKQRAATLTAERNKLQRNLLQYTAIDPKTGLLGIDKMKAEMASLRRGETVKNNKIAGERDFWVRQHSMLAQEYAKLAKQYDNMRQGLYPSTNLFATPNYPPGILPAGKAIVPGPTNTFANPVTNPFNNPLDNTPTNTPTPSSQQSPNFIDLTGDDTESPVSDPGNCSNTDSFGSPLPIKDGALTDFHRKFRSKNMSWLFNTETDSDAASRLYYKQTPERRKNDKSAFDSCRDVIYMHNGVRRALGGQFSQMMTHYEGFIPQAPEDPTKLSRKNGESSTRQASRKTTHKSTHKLIDEETIHKPTNEETTHNATDEETVYQPTDEELAAVMERELAEF
ncbi:hypothetical protein N7520_000756 [Penicillium odoratum]|uniref:uncharacterized protein n=1 Tax=Penicillium odoratum TaxID=1167516 RepID=UPI002549B6B6|nr:uncharacterized protein N7520_000756 [Penicillium odoratum]KAJ5777510.1 hypothetical protein N7520_000756 [Penicillium odoratum]